MQVQGTPTRRRRRFLPWLLVVLVLELLAGAGVVVASRGSPIAHPRVPRVVGLTVPAADRVLQKAGLTPEVSGETYSSNVAVGRVIRQLPRDGRLRKGAVVKMVVSEGRHPTVLPNLKGMTATKARSALLGAHLKEQLSYVYSERVHPGIVVSWTSVAGTRVFFGDLVKVVVSKGLEPQKIPADLKGGVLTWAQAEAALANLHLKAKEEPVYSTTILPGFVVNTDPLPGTSVPGHSTVIVFTSIGPPFVKVPQLFADSATAAEAKLSSLGLKWRLFGPPGADFVLTTIPGTGTSVRVGSTIDLYLY